MNGMNSMTFSCQKFSAIGIEIQIPQIVVKQIKRVNYSTENPKEYYKLAYFFRR